MLTQTAQAAASIQYPAPICTPYFGEMHLPIREGFPYIVWLSDFRPETLIRTPTFILPRWSASPAPFRGDETLSWDSDFGPVPIRPSGEITVCLEYLGRGTPVELAEYWD